MPYVVMMDPIGSNGLPMGQPVMRNVPSEDAGLRIMKGAALDARQAQRRILFSLYDHSKRLVLSYTSVDGALKSLGAFAP